MVTLKIQQVSLSVNNISSIFFSLLLRFIGLNYAMSLFYMYFWNFVSIIIFKFGTQNLKNFANSS